MSELDHKIYVLFLTYILHISYVFKRKMNTKDLLNLIQIEKKDFVAIKIFVTRFILWTLTQFKSEVLEPKLAIWRFYSHFDGIFWYLGVNSLSVHPFYNQRTI